MLTRDSRALKWMKKYLRYTDYLGVAQLYLKDNFLLREKLEPKHFKARILGHWGTVPGLNLIYANMNYLIHKHACEMLFVTGPGHGAPAILANLFAEGSLDKFYKKRFPVNLEGMGNIIKDFSWPHSGFPSHVTPGVPGSILEGGELGYSLSTAFGAVLDNPNLIAVSVIGDGEAETGPIAAAWHSNKFFNPRTSGAVLPIVHINGYKISNPTIYGRMSDKELVNLFKGYGYEPLIVSGKNVAKKMIKASEKAYQMIRKTQEKARKYSAAEFRKLAKSKSDKVLKPKWPVILLRTEKGWKGIHDYHGHAVESSFHAHGIPIGHPNDDPDALEAVEKWMQSYKVEELVDEKGVPKKEVLKFMPEPKLRMGMNKNAVGGDVMKALKLPSLSKYEVKLVGKVKDDKGIKSSKNGKSAKGSKNYKVSKSQEPNLRGKMFASSMATGGEMLRDIFAKNKNNFRLFCPDEVDSNKLSAVFEKTARAFMWPLNKNDEKLATDGRVMEMLSEHTLQGWYQGYLLTGRHGIFVSYEAFNTIITSMVDQYAKFLKQSFHVPWRKPVSAAVYLLSSLGWRQDHNGYSHQNPSFVSNVLQKHGKFCQIYYPADANSFVVALEEVYNKKDAICVIVAGKRKLPQWLTLKEAKEQAKNGIGIWEWVGGSAASKNPDVVLASAGDYLTQEALFAVKMCQELVPELKIRYVNVSELTSIGLGDYCHDKGNCMTETGVNQYFTKDRPVVFSYHGYVNDVEQILWPYTTSDRFTIHGYKEEGSTTTPFDMKVANGVSCYHLAVDLIEKGALRNKKVAAKKAKLIKEIKKKITSHQAYIKRYGDDPKEVKEMGW